MFVVGVTNYTFVPYHYQCAIKGLAPRNDCAFPVLGPVFLWQILDFACIDYVVQTVYIRGLCRRQGEIDCDSHQASKVRMRMVIGQA